MKTIVNAAPGVVDLGLKDESTRPYGGAPEEIPQHLPKYFIYAQKGPLDEQLTAGGARLNLYGDDTFTELSEYFNHQTFHSNLVNAEGNSAMYVRVLPTDAGPKPTARISLDVLPTTVDLYERSADGSIKKDVAGDPIVIGTTNGYRVKFVVDHYATVTEAQDFGTIDISPGSQTDPVTNVQSEKVPLFEIEHNFFGKDGNLAGFRLWPTNTENSVVLPTKMIAKERAYPYNFAVVRKSKRTNSAGVVETIFGEQSIPVSFKPGVIDPLTMVRLYFGERVVEPYQNVTDTRYEIKYGEFGRVKIYQENIDRLLKMFHAAEVPFLTAESDFTADASEYTMFNFVTGTDTRNIPYHSYVFSDTSGAVDFGQFSNIYLAGGSDGTMSHQGHADLVSDYMLRYRDPNDELMEVAYHVESHFYDTGFPLDNKRDLINFISERKDTFIHLTPYDAGDRVLTASEEYSIATSILTWLNLHPESTYFGTSVYRAMIMGGVARVRASQVVQPMPLNFEVGIKSARYMGAGNGKWKNGFNFDGYPGHIIERQFDPSIKWTPDSVRNRNWDVGLNWVQRYDRRRFMFPAMKTVYSNDTSVMTSYLTACACIQLNKIAHKAHRTFTGTSGLTPAQFTERVNNFVKEEVKDLFDGRYIIVPKAHFTTLDEVRNYSWTLPIEIYAPGMYTVMTAYVVARRIQDYQD